MKEALYYSIRRNLYHNVVAVTTEKPSRYNGFRWHGRDCTYNESTHGTDDQLMGKFPSQEAAEAKRTQMRRIADHYNAQRKTLQDAITMLYASERKALEDCVKES